MQSDTIRNAAGGPGADGVAKRANAADGLPPPPERGEGRVQAAPAMRPLTIVQAIQAVLREPPGARTIDQIYACLRERSLYDFRAVDPKSVVRSQVRRHCVGLDFPSASPVKYFRSVDGDRYALAPANGAAPTSTLAPPPASNKDRVPEEVIDDAYKEHLASLRQQLKDRILGNHPAFFERLVIELLLKMGYGGGDPALGVQTGGPDDEGVDGIIKEDQLGLDQIYIQAKRWALNRVVKRVEVQRFAGAMNKVKKGVFLTTARFGPRARKFARSHEKTISLIDGDALCDLMVKHGVGVSEVKVLRLLRVDNDYFSVEE